jgi:flavin-dependent dehydrogenase
LDRLVGLALIADAEERPRANVPATAVVEAAPCGWWYAATIPRGRELAVFFTDADLLPRGRHNLGEFLRDQLARSPLTRPGRDFVEERLGRRQWTGFDARSGIRRTAIADGWVAIGDALMAFDPLCGRGVTEALACGIEVADWLLRAGRADEEDGLPNWTANAAERFNQYCAQRVATYGAQKRWGDMAFWQRRQRSRTPVSSLLPRANRPTSMPTYTGARSMPSSNSSLQNGPP